MSIVRFNFLVFSIFLLCLSFTSTKMLPSLNFFMLKGSEPSIATKVLLIAKGDSLHKGLSSSVAMNKSEQNQSLLS